MRILLVTETLLAGGAETFVIRLANALADEHDMTIAVLHGELANEALIAKIDPRISVERLKLPAKRLLFTLERLLRNVGVDLSLLRTAQDRWIAALVAKTTPDVLHSHLLKADRTASHVRVTHPAVRHVLTLHGDYAPFLEGQADPQMLRLEKRASEIIDRADGIAAICREQVEWVEATFPATAEKTKLIYNGYAPWKTRRKAPVTDPAGPLVFGMVSRGVERKGWAKAIAAFGQLPRGAAKLVLVGDGPYIDKLRRGPVPDGVRFIGFSADPVEWIDGFDVGLLPSEFPHESLPTVVMEYLFCGKAVIATDVGEIREMLRAPDGGLAGTLLEFDGNQISLAQLTAAMQFYVEDPELRRAHAARARAAFAKFDMATCAASYAEMYAEVAGSTPISSATAASH